MKKRMTERERERVGKDGKVLGREERERRLRRTQGNYGKIMGREMRQRERESE